ncbi:MAG: hypothetical protein QQN41_10475 [Nitrosopumilus sp.]
MKNNTLYQYQGGGYSGCTWEWNFFFIDKDGVFYDIFSSGSNGIADLEAAEKAWAKVDKTEDFGYVYRLNNPDELKELAQETHAELVLSLVKWFEENQNNEVYAICADCVCKIFDPDEIRVEAADTWCCDCHSSGMCDECCEYVGVDEICYDVNKIGDVIDFSDEVLEKLAENLADDVHHCEYCLEALAQDIANSV